MKLSAALVTFNEEANIGRTLSALRGLADEIILVDSFSADHTVDIARGLGAKVFQEPWPGHVQQKNSALLKCSGDWVLSLDADEELTRELADAIERVLRVEDGTRGYLLRRRTFYLGRLLRYAWQPDLRLRLVRRDARPRWTGLNPHDRLEVEGPVRALPGYLIHYSFRDFAAHMENTKNHARTGAQSYYASGRRATALDLLCRPPLRFCKSFFWRKAFLDGLPGISAALSSAVSVYMKYAFLWELQKNADRGQTSTD
jgi:glycosyltransferase involved in cell wall biosynthesis